MLGHISSKPKLKPIQGLMISPQARRSTIHAYTYPHTNLKWPLAAYVACLAHCWRFQVVTNHLTPRCNITLGSMILHSLMSAPSFFASAATAVGSPSRVILARPRLVTSLVALMTRGSMPCHRIVQKQQQQQQQWSLRVE